MSIDTNEQRWCIVSDDSGHRYLCPADRVDEYAEMVELLNDYYDEGDYEDDAPPFPDFVVSLYGRRLTFASPLLDGEEIAGCGNA